MCFIHLVLYITFTFSSLQANTDKKTYTNQCMLTKATPTNVIFPLTLSHFRT